jgi:predicted DNA-binding transcriptional regulator AlpA
MSAQCLASVREIDSGPGRRGRVAEASPSPPARRLIDAKEVGRTLGCSWRTVYRLADAGLMPWGVKLGGLRRWDSQEIEVFIAGGCPSARPGTR